MISVSIIILSYNTKDLLWDCLSSIYKFLPKDFFEIIVVDNASTDGSSEMVKKKYSQVKLVQSQANLGFAKGINLGAEKAIGEYLLFLNSDAVLDNSEVINMIQLMRKNSQIAVTGGMLLNRDKTAQRTYSTFYTLPAVFVMLLMGDKVEIMKENLSIGKTVDWVSGGFMMVRKVLFEKLNGFDEHFFMYIEDMELCYRAKQAGFDVYIYPKAKAIHTSQGSSSRSFAVIQIYKGLIYFYQKHKDTPELLLLRTMLICKALILSLFGTITGNRYLKETYSKALQEAIK